MKVRFLALLWLALLTFSASAQHYMEMIDAGNFPVSTIQKEAEAYFDIVGRGRGTGYKQYKRWEYVAMMELDNNGVKISNFELSQGARDYRRTETLSRTESGSSLDQWTQLGPTYRNATSSWNPGVGRVSSIGIDASNTNHLIVGSPSGGVWKSLNGGNTWTPLTDNYATVDVYALEISPYNSNIYLWGGASGKIFRSIDGGANWTTTGNVSGTGKVSRIQFHPTNPNLVYAVSESNGLFRSTNGGLTWSAVAGVSSIPGYDIEFKPGDPNTIYFSGISVYRSTNGGTTFSQINGFSTASDSYKMMGVSAANPNIVYLLESDGGRFGAFYKSTNSGTSFTKLVDGSTINYFGYSSTGDDDKGQAPRDMDVAVNPSNANEVVIAGVQIWKSSDGGTSFSLKTYWIPGTAASLGVGYTHADIALLKFAGSALYVGSDGGIHISTNGATSFVDHSIGLGIREFYKIGVSKTNPNVVSGGAQDNGTSVMRGPNREWVDWLGADGMETFVNWNNANTLYGTSQYGSMYRSNDQGNTQNSISKPPGVGDGAWVTPFEQDPQVSTTIYVAFADVWKSANSGTSWAKISSFDNGNINQMKLAPSDNKRIYVSRGASLFTTADGGTNWTTTAISWGSSTINYIAVHPQNPQRLLIVTAAAVYQSINAGASWTNIGVSLPGGAKYCAAWENTGKNGIYIGGFGFVSYTNDDLAGQWVGFLNGLPNARVYELEINYVSNTIFAGTYGRGLWESPLYHGLAPLAAFSADKLVGCHEMTVAFSDRSNNAPSAWEWTFDGGMPATSTLQNPVVAYTEPGIYTVRLKCSNNIGENTAEAIDYITIVAPTVPIVANEERCGPGELTLEATGFPADQYHWYASATDTAVLFTGNEYIVDIAQTTTFYVANGTEYLQSQHLGPASNNIGDGDNHAGNYFLILDVEKPFRLKSATVYATGAENRTFQLRDANANLLLEKTVFVEEGESRVILDMDIPAGFGLQIGCPSPANLFRNNTGVSYPYSIPGLAQIKSSTAGPDYYYYLYDLEVENYALCESDRVPLIATINPLPSAPMLLAPASTIICPGESLVLNAENLCPDCSVLWSNGDSVQSITVSTDGQYTAAFHNTCGDGPVSNAIMVIAANVPEAPAVAAAGATMLCPGETVLLTATNLCPGCTIYWSTDASDTSIVVSTGGSYSAVFNNVCGDGPASNAIDIINMNLPGAPSIVAAGATVLCPGESVLLAAEDLCSGCTLNWSTGENGPDITVAMEGDYTATWHNTCGDGQVSNAIAVMSMNLPDAPGITAAGATLLCPGESVLLAADNLCPGCTLNWSTGESGPNITVTTEGNYTATWQNTCGDGPVSNAIDVMSMNLPNAPGIAAAGATLLCPGEAVLLAVENLCPGCTLNWSTGESGPNITVATEGNYTATWQNTCGDGPASSPIAVMTLQLPDSVSITANGTTMLCPGESVLLAADNLCPGCTLNWSTGESTPSITASAEGLYSATPHNSCGEGPASNTISVLFETLPEALEISASGPTTLCPGEMVVLTAGNICAGCTVNWSTAESGPAITVGTAGAYFATALNTCGSSAESNTIVLNSYPSFVPVLQLDNQCHLSAPPGSAYQWFVDGQKIPGANEQFLTAMISGQYSVSMNDTTGCSGISEAVFAQECVSGLQDLDGLVSVHMYPNPAQDKVFLDIKTLQTANIHFDLYGVDGRYIGQLFQGEILPGRQILEIALPDVPSGMYRYRLATELGSINGNLVLQHH